MVISREEVHLELDLENGQHMELTCPTITAIGELLRFLVLVHHMPRIMLLKLKWAAAQGCRQTQLSKW
ncbi:unnamed protein product [Linum trigynum]|uniref:Uncharacterized protein n=1 Tax=Linum trigynum TaxID=586398 RepID=A0AAV2GN96_9ROSI